MDFLLPDERTMELMRNEFENLDISGRARAMTSALFAQTADTYGDTSENESQNSLHLRKKANRDAETTSASEEVADKSEEAARDESFDNCGALDPCGRQKARAYALLYLYFVKVLGYNSIYGTQIYDAQRSLGGLRSVACPFRAVNGLD